MRIPTMIAAITLDALAGLAAKHQRAVERALKRMAAGDPTGERDADAAMAKLDAVVAQMDAIEAGMVGASKGRAEIAAALAA